MKLKRNPHCQPARPWFLGESFGTCHAERQRRIPAFCFLKYRDSSVAALAQNDRPFGCRRKAALRYGFICIVVAAAVLCAILPRPARAQTIPPALFSGLRWRLIGPFRGGRSVAATGVPGHPDLFYFGAVDGGVWKSEDTGLIWTPIFDKEPIASIGAIAVAPSNPQIIYVGSGEADMRSDISYGNGMYKSTDGGKTWQHIGLEASEQIGRIIVDPHDPNRLFVAALGHAYGPNPERGVFRSLDGGQTWQKVLYKDENTGAIDLAFDPQSSQTLYAALWATRRPPWNVYPPSNGFGGLYKSTDGGSTWTRLMQGLPSEGVGRIGIAVAPSNPSRVYALVDATKGGVYRSDDAGAAWHLFDSAKRIWGRGWYFGGITVDPKNPDVVYVMNTSVYRSTDGGKTFIGFKGAPGGDDYHQLWINPDHPNRMILASDQGVVVSVDGGETWSSWNNQPTGQFYHVVADHRFPFSVYGAQQDSGARSVTTRGRYGRITFHDWKSICAGGESGYVAIDPANQNLLFGGSYTGSVARCNQATGVGQNISPTLAYPGRAFRHTWTMPVVFSQTNPPALYFANQYLFRTTDGGQSWQMISPDLTRPHPGVPRNLDPATARDTTALERHSSRWGVIYTIAPSPIRANEIWVGTDDGLIWVTENGAKDWTNVTPPALPSWSKVTMIAASRFDPGAAYAAVDRHRLDDFRPYLYRTRDHGKTWQLITRGIPAGAYLNAIKADPVRQGLLFAGTELGVYVSFDDGDDWQSLQLNLPVASIRDFAIRDNDLVVATHGRSFWVLDDISPLRQVTSQIAESETFLFKPAQALRIRAFPSRAVTKALYADLDPLRIAAGEDAPAGALIDYYLKSAVQGRVTLEILDSSGRTVRSYSNSHKPLKPNPRKMDIPAAWIRKSSVLSTAAGAHRFAWDLHYASASAPSGHPSFFGSNAGPWAMPGHYMVKLTVNGSIYTQPLTVKEDPREQVPLEVLQEQFAMAQAIEAARAKSSQALHETSQVQKQLHSLKQRAADHPSVAAGIQALDQRIAGIAGRAPTAPPDTSGVGNGTPSPASLLYLRGFLGRVEASIEGADAAPTSEARKGFEEAQQTLNATLTDWNEVKTTDLPRLNRLLRQAGLPSVSVKPAQPKSSG